VEAEVAVLPQLTPDGQDQILDGRIGPSGLAWDAGAIAPIHAVEPPASGVADPMMDRGLTDIEFVGDLVLRSAVSYGGDDGPSSSGFPLTLFMAASGKGCSFSVQITPD
jgi:hypothetical protein